MASQSLFETASLGANLIHELTLVLMIGAAALFVAVLVLLVRGTWSAPAPVNTRRWLVGGGIALPVLVLTALLVQGLRTGVALSHAPDLKALEVEVIARRWWWELRYRDPAGDGRVVLANELHLPRDCAATLTLVSNDVIHSFWVPALAGKVDAIPGRRNQLVLHATDEGRYRGECAEYCGTQHANMALEVVVESPQAFRDWLLNQASPAASPAETDTEAQRGQQAFDERGCGTCHAIRGTAAAGVLGPDLTHVASRRLIASATLVNDTGSLVAWLRDAQHLKPGNLMPSVPQTDDDELRAIAHYLASLR